MTAALGAGTVRKGSLDVSLWQELREAGQEPAIDEEPLPPPPVERPDPV